MRYEEAGIPEGSRAFNTKLELAEDILREQGQNGGSFDFIGGDGYYGNDANLARSINQMGYVYMLDIHSDQKIFIDQPELFLPERKSNRGPAPKRLKASTPDMTVTKYMENLQPGDWEKIKVRNTTKGKLTGEYHFARVFIWNKNINEIEPRMLVIRKTKSAKNTIEIKYSFTKANLEQYTRKSLAYMQAQRFFVEHCIKESKQILGIDQFQTRKWLAWQHQVALNFMVSSFILKEKLRNFEDLPLRSANDIKKWFVFKLYKEMTKEQFFDQMHQRHKTRQRDINSSYKRF